MLRRHARTSPQKIVPELRPDRAHCRQLSQTSKKPKARLATGIQYHLLPLLADRAYRKELSSIANDGMLDLWQGGACRKRVSVQVVFVVTPDSNLYEIKGRGCVEVRQVVSPRPDGCACCGHPRDRVSLSGSVACTVLESSTAFPAKVYPVNGFHWEGGTYKLHSCMASRFTVHRNVGQKTASGTLSFASNGLQIEPCSHSAKGWNSNTSSMHRF